MVVRLFSFQEHFKRLFNRLVRQYQGCRPERLSLVMKIYYYIFHNIRFAVEMLKECFGNLMKRPPVMFTSFL